MDVVLNEAQRAALSFYFSLENQEGEPMPLDEPYTIEVHNGQLVVNYAYLHTDGEWATFPQPSGSPR